MNLAEKIRLMLPTAVLPALVRLHFIGWWLTRHHFLYLPNRKHVCPQGCHQVHCADVHVVSTVGVICSLSFLFGGVFCVVFFASFQG